MTALSAVSSPEASSWTSTPLKGWHRPISRAQLLGVSLVVLGLWLLAMVAGGWAFWQHWETRLLLRHQPLSLTLPEGLLARAEVVAPLRTPIDIRPRIPVTVDQVLDVRLQDSLTARVQLQASLPVDTVVAVRQVVPVQTEVSLPFRFDGLLSWLPAFTVKVPVAMSLPIDMAVPVKTQVPVALDMVVSGQWPDHLPVPLKAQMVVRPRVRAEVSAQLVQQVNFALLGPVQPVDLLITQLDLGLPLRSLGWRWADPDAARPWW
ncbi:hypothetical protein [Aquabacterium sp.]|uniref:hypothetical protein n=1 Tax=Aquabacterium sp. TaxID=1872578 RepID=UPI0025C581E1|nr:hypothetical protein [Aquabacterium sp.]